MFMDRKIHYCWGGNTPQTDLRTQFNPCQDPNWLLCRNLQADHKIHMQLQEPYHQTSLKKQEQSWRIHFPISKITIKQPRGTGIG